MAEELEFRLRLKRDAGFELDVEGRVPLSGITGLTGPSGSGKTTLLRVLAGLESCSNAMIRFGRHVWQDSGEVLPPEARRIGFVFQDAALFPHLNVLQNIQYGARRRDVASFDAIVEALDLAPLLPRAVGGLSGGEARRVALGRALAADPAILFLDEPMSGLDRVRKDALIPYISRAVAEARVPALYVTHSQHEINALADRVLGVENGKLTGWQAPPVRLVATVTEAGARFMEVVIDGTDASLSLPSSANPGEKIGLGVAPSSLVVSANPPGRSSAVVVLPARVVDGEGGVTVAIGGQRLNLPMSGAYAIGAKVWVSVASVAHRIEVSDSAKNRR